MFQNLPTNQLASINQRPTNVRLYLDVNGLFYLPLTLPNEDEMNEVRFDIKPDFSFRTLAESNKSILERKFELEYSKFSEKKDRFNNSKIYWNRLANLAKLSGHFDSMLDYLSEAKSNDEEDIFIENRYVQALINNEDYDKAFFRLTNDIAHDTRSKIQLAFLLTRKNDYLSAQRIVDEALNEDPTNFDARLFAGTLCLYFQKWEKSLRHFRVALGEDRKTSPLYVNMALAYWMLNQEEKAESSLKKALLLDPLNKNALLFYGNIASNLGKINEILPFFEFFLDYDQCDCEAWEKYGVLLYKEARSSGRVELHRKSLDAFKMQNTIESTSSTWNNIGLNYWRLGQPSKARKYFSQSIALSSPTASIQTFLLPVYNYALMLWENKHYSEVIKFSSKFLESPDVWHEGAGYILDKLKFLYVTSLDEVESFDTYKPVFFAEKVLDYGLSNIEIEYEFNSLLLIWYSGKYKDESKLRALTNNSHSLVESRNSVSKNLRKKYINNLAFSYCILNEVDKASDLLNLISYEFYIDPYSTATLGLIRLKRDKVESADKLYSLATNLVLNDNEKERFKLRKNFEFGNYFYNQGDYKKAVMYLNKAVKSKSDAAHLIESSLLLTNKVKRLLLRKDA